jgi:hypothetical protein
MRRRSTAPRQDGIIVFTQLIRGAESQSLPDDPGSDPFYIESGDVTETLVAGRDGLLARLKRSAKSIKP